MFSSAQTADKARFKRVGHGLLRVSEGLMKSAVLFFELMKDAPCCRWRWRSDDGKTESKLSFGYYLSCLADARANGYDVRTDHIGHVPNSYTPASPASGIAVAARRATRSANRRSEGSVTEGPPSSRAVRLA